MDMGLVLPVIASLMVAGIVVYGVWEFLLSSFYKKKKGLLVRVFLYERVGNDIIFVKQTSAEEKKDVELGNFLLLKDGKIPLERISNTDFFQDKVFGKALNVIKYAPDDFRPLVRLREGEFIRKYQKPKVELVEVEDPDNAGEVQIIEKEVKDKSGRVVMEVVEEVYSEPLGISKDDRQATRFNLAYRKRMEKRFAEKQDLWNKIAPFAVPAVAMMLLFMGFVHFSNKDTERAKDWYAEVNVEAVQFYKQMENPSFVEGLMQKAQNKDKEDNAPPK